MDWLRGGGKAQTVITLITILVLLLGFSGVVPPDYFMLVFMVVMGSVIAYIVISFLYPFIRLAGKPMLAISFYKSSSEVEWAFGKVAEVEGGVLFKECPGGGKSLICAEIESVPFVGTRVPFRLVVLKFPEDVDPESLFDNDYVEPESGFGRVPVRIAYISGVQIGEMVLSHKTAFKTFRDKLLETMGKKVERVERVPIIYVTRYKLLKVKVLKRVVDFLKSLRDKVRRDSREGDGEVRFPVVLVTGYKAADVKVLNNVVEQLKGDVGYQEVKGSAKAWVSELGQVKIISTELEELRAEVMKLRQVIRGLERIYQSPPSITTVTFNVESEGESTKDKVVKYGGLSLGALALVLFILFLLGVIGH